MDSLWSYPVGKIWVLEGASDLQLRLSILKNSGLAGHSGRDATESPLRSNFYWQTMTEDVKTSVRACFHCLPNLGREKIPRRFGPPVHGTKRNELVKFDYIEPRHGNSDDK